MYFKEIIEGLNLSPDQTRKVHILCMDCFQKGAAFMSVVLAPEANCDMLANTASGEATRIFIDKEENKTTEMFPDLYGKPNEFIDRIFKLNFEGELP